MIFDLQWSDGLDPTWTRTYAISGLDEASESEKNSIRPF